MPFILHCPTCHNGLTVNESSVPYVVTCPSCRHPLTVPAIFAAPAAVAEEPFAMRPEEPNYRYRDKRRSSIGMTLLWSGLGLWLLSAVLLIVGYVGVIKAVDEGARNVVAFIVPIYGGWCMAFLGTIFFFMGLLAIVIQAGVRDAKN